MSIRLSAMLVHVEVGPPLELKEPDKRVDADLDSCAEGCWTFGGGMECEGDGRGPEGGLQLSMGGGWAVLQDGNAEG